MPGPKHEAGDTLAVTIRPMLASDVSAALALLQESPEAALWSQESLVDATSQWVAFGAVLGGQIVGFIIGRPVASEFEILNLAVGKNSRRKGIASRLIQSAIDSARAGRVAQIFLEVRPSNAAGIALYTQMGFRLCGERKNYYRDPIEDAMLFIFEVPVKNT